MANFGFVRRFFLGLSFIWACGCGELHAEAPSDYFTPPETMYSFADFWVVRPLDLAVLPITATTWVVSLPVTAASGTSDQAYDLMIRQLAQHMMKRPMGQFWDWENRDQSRPVVIKFSDGYSMAELTPEQERKYRRALQEHVRGFSRLKERSSYRRKIGKLWPAGKSGVGKTWCGFFCRFKTFSLRVARRVSGAR
jgi:hypothetical protein